MNKVFLSFSEARKFVRCLGLGSKSEWKDYSKTFRPSFIPSNPNATYKNEWVSHQDWMGYSYKNGDAQRKYRVNERFFQKWSSETAYVLGFWFADGHITGEKKKEYIFAISQMEKEILKDISRVMGSTFPIVEERVNGKTSYKLVIRSQDIVNDVIRLGGKYRKSLDMTFPFVPVRFLSDFVRGLWDGDGSAFISKDGRAIASLTCGSKSFVDELVDKLNKHVKIYPSIVKDRRREAYYVVLDPNDSRRLRDYLYKEDKNTLYLNRKKINFYKMGDVKDSPSTVSSRFLPYEQARNEIQSLGVNTSRGWFLYWKQNTRPANIPANPPKSYKGKGWKGWDDWLGKKGG